MKTASTSRSRATAKAARVDHGQRRTAVADAMLSDIFRGHLKAGTRLVIHDLAARYGVSPTPIREALATLEGIGVVDIAPNCGAVVRRMTATDVEEVSLVRNALECAAVKLACGRIETAELEELAALLRQQAKTALSVARASSDASLREIKKAIDAARSLDSRLHDLIAEASGNRFLAKELGRLKLLFRTFRDAAWDRRRAAADLARFPEEAHEHLAIVTALLANDATAAARAMARHIESGMTYWARGLET